MLGLAIVMGIAFTFTMLCHFIQCYKDGEMKRLEKLFNKLS